MNNAQYGGNNRVDNGGESEVKAKDVTLSDYRKEYESTVGSGGIANGNRMENIPSSWWFWKSTQDGELNGNGIKNQEAQGGTSANPQVDKIGSTNNNNSNNNNNNVQEELNTGMQAAVSQPAESAAQVAVPLVSESVPAPVSVPVAAEQHSPQLQQMQDESNGRMNWVSWINPVPIVSAAFSYVYADNTGPTQQSRTILPNELSSVVNSNEITSDAGSSHIQEQDNSNNNGYLTWITPWSYWQKNKGESAADTTEELAERSMYSSVDSAEIANDAKKALTNNINGNNGSSYWGFHSKPNKTKKFFGELAVVGTGSENHPARMVNPPITFLENQERLLNDARNRDEVKPLIVPNMNENYRNITFKTKTRIILSKNKFLNEKLHFKKETHLYRLSPKEQLLSNKKMKKAVIIGLHGFYPIKMVKTLIGRQTGTASTFVNMATAALWDWCASNDCDIDLDTIALEFDGKISEGCENLIKLLNKNWIDVIKNCDFLYIVSNSQSCIVATHLLEKLVEQKIILSANQKVSMLNMDGIFQGPFNNLDSKLILKNYSPLENGTLNEVFNFQKNLSFESSKLISSLNRILQTDANVKISFIGSISDCFVPLYSSLFLNIDHPNIFRCCYVDANSNEEDTPKFLIELINILLFLKNVGYPDNHLVFELSESLAGTVTGKYPDDFYENKDIYVLGIKNCLETTDLIDEHTCENIDMNFDSKTLNKNPYYLPYFLKSFLNQLDTLGNDKNIRGKELKAKLLAVFAEWNPKSKKFKDLKYAIDVIYTEGSFI
ncbi:hypothetical protein PACTADRAFT_48681 [Pachysolen tannophilus NRRL Y-2460]|uniref:YMC020W-like alpha/beta hydrolase domain-containing protein n=1 Tax=Pachysolen tannophilus NRRL Y-2460 TaxID=669874 RepID=A0A1E4TYS4_PACTA|nr:hypothetical protein PACTADRAFT_48681 [Pachysolen tannophilus NRRL Y-2460]